MGVEVGAQAARSRALAVLRVRSRALAVALLPAAVAVVLLAGGSSGHLVGPGWDVARWITTTVGLVVLLAAAGIAVVVARARPAVSPTVPITEEAAPDLYRLVRDLADRLDVPTPSAIALTPDCDSWLEDRTHPSHGTPAEDAGGRKAATGAEGRASAPQGIRGGGTPHHRVPIAPVLVIGSPFLWWMRVGELRAVLAPVVAGTGPSAHPDIALARRFVRGLDAAVAVSAAPGRGPLLRAALGGVGWVARLLLRSCRGHAGEMERGVAAAAAERAQAVDYGLRIVAQEQVGLAYAGWDRLLTRVALPAWRMGRWPSRLDAGVVAALTELSRRDRLAEGFASRLGERPACDLLEEPGLVDEAASLLAARLFHGGPAEPGPDWAPVDWGAYPEEVVDRKWRTDAARLHRVLDSLGICRTGDPASVRSAGPTLSRVIDHLTTKPAEESGRPGAQGAGWAAQTAPSAAGQGYAAPDRAEGPDAVRGAPGHDGAAQDPGRASHGSRHVSEAAANGAAHGFDPRSDTAGHGPGGAPHLGPDSASDTTADDARHHVPGTTADGSRHVGGTPEESPNPAEPGSDAFDREAARRVFDAEDREDVEGPGALLAAGLSAEVAREEAAAPPLRPVVHGPPGSGPDALWDDGVPLFPLQAPRTGRELLADHVTAMVCCAAIDTAGAAPGLDWLDGPSLLVDGERAADLVSRVLTLVEDGDPGPLRGWLAGLGVRPEKPVRLV
ncbi:hypothetical protein ACWCP6_09385 [Streptomyces sp. NPDC002004]